MHGVTHKVWSDPMHGHPHNACNDPQGMEGPTMRGVTHKAWSDSLCVECDLQCMN